MKSLFRENGVEAVIGLLVVLLAAWFVVFAWQRTGGGGFRDSISVTALFPAANGVSPGTDVRIAGLKVGTVTDQHLDPKSYQAEVTMALDKTVPVPSDSTAVISSEGLLGGTYIAIIPGGSTTRLKTGDMIFDTQGSVDMMSLIGSLINGTGGGGSSPSPAPSGGGLGTMDESSGQ